MYIVGNNGKKIMEITTAEYLLLEDITEWGKKPYRHDEPEVLDFSWWYSWIDDILSTPFEDIPIEIGKYTEGDASYKIYKWRLKIGR